MNHKKFEKATLEDVVRDIEKTTTSIGGTRKRSVNLSQRPMGALVVKEIQ
jgi:hypothetical protein